MYKVLLVEDEMLVRIGLENSINWEDYNMQIVAAVSNGDEALKAYEKYKPDIMITDIKMPILNGRELIKKIRETDLDIKIIVITCLEEFELAREMISFGVSGYIVKLTMTIEDIEKELLSCMQSLNTIKNKQDSNDLNNNNLQKQDLTQGFIYTENCSCDLLKNSLELKGFNVDAEKFVISVIEIEYDKEQMETLDNKSKYILRKNLLQSIEGVVNGYRRCEVFFDYENRCVILTSFNNYENEKKIMNEFNKIIEQIEKIISTYFNYEVNMGWSGPCNSFEDITSIYKDSVIALKNTFFMGTNKEYYDDSLIENRKLYKEEVKAVFQDLNSEFNLSNNENRLLFDSEIDESIFESKNKFVEFLLEVVKSSIGKLGIEKEKKTTLELEYEEIIRKSTNFEVALESLSSFTGEITKITNSNRRISLEVIKTIIFIEENYVGNITLNEASLNVNLSSSYLSYLFKKEMDINFIEYLNRYRIEKAKELLKTTHMKSYEIGKLVGLPENSYFSRTFKKISGVGPNEYRKKAFLWSSER